MSQAISIQPKSKVINDGTNDSLLDVLNPHKLARTRPTLGPNVLRATQMTTLSTSFTGTSTRVIMLRPSSFEPYRIYHGVVTTHPVLGGNCIGWDINPFQFDEKVDTDRQFRAYRALTYGMRIALQNVPLSANQFNGAVEVASFNGWPQIHPLDPTAMSRLDPKRFDFIGTVAKPFSTLYVPSSDVPFNQVTDSTIATPQSARYLSKGTTWENTLVSGVSAGQAVWTVLAGSGKLVTLAHSSNSSLGPGWYEVEISLNLGVATIGAPSSFALGASYINLSGATSLYVSKALELQVLTAHSKVIGYSRITFYSPIPLEEIYVNQTGGMGTGTVSGSARFNVTRFVPESDDATQVILYRDLDPAATFSIQAYSTTEVVPSTSIVKLMTTTTDYVDDILDLQSLFDLGQKLGNFVSGHQEKVEEFNRLATTYSDRSYNSGRASMIGDFFSRVWKAAKQVIRPALTTLASSYIPELAAPVSSGLQALGFAAMSDKDPTGRAMMHDTGMPPPCIQAESNLLCPYCARMTARAFGEPVPKQSTIYYASKLSVPPSLPGKRNPLFWEKMLGALAESKEIEELYSGSARSSSSSSTNNITGRAMMEESKVPPSAAPVVVQEATKLAALISSLVTIATEDTADIVDKARIQLGPMPGTPGIVSGKVSAAVFPFVADADNAVKPALITITMRPVKNQSYKNQEYIGWDEQKYNVNISTNFTEDIARAKIAEFIRLFVPKPQNLNNTYISLEGGKIREDSWNLAMIAALLGLPLKVMWTGAVAVDGTLITPGGLESKIAFSKTAKMPLIVAVAPTDQILRAKAVKSLTALMSGATVTGAYVSTVGEAVALSPYIFNLPSPSSIVSAETIARNLKTRVEDEKSSLTPTQRATQKLMLETYQKAKEEFEKTGDEAAQEKILSLAQMLEGMAPKSLDKPMTFKDHVAAKTKLTEIFKDYKQSEDVAMNNIYNLMQSILAGLENHSSKIRGKLGQLMTWAKKNDLELLSNLQAFLTEEEVTADVPKALAPSVMLKRASKVRDYVRAFDVDKRKFLTDDRFKEFLETAIPTLAVTAKGVPTFTLSTLEALEKKQEELAAYMKVATTKKPSAKKKVVIFE